MLIFFNLAVMLVMLCALLKGEKDMRQKYFLWV